MFVLNSSSHDGLPLKLLRIDFGDLAAIICGIGGGGHGGGGGAFGFFFSTKNSDLLNKSWK